MYSATPTQVRRAQTVPSLSARNAERQFVMIVGCGAVGNRSANHAVITTQ
jgi:hypothetical protein